MVEPAVPVLPDLLGPDLKVVFCGTAAGRRSAELRQYYAGPGNKFWRILRDVGLTPGAVPMAASDWRSLTQHGIGLTDLVKMHSGSDASLPAHGFDPGRLRAWVIAHAPRALAFNGKKAAQAFFGMRVDYGRQPQEFGRTALWVLPSTSGAASGFWNAGYWHDLAASLRSASD